jgi:uncharacterized protein (TIGR01777 family)
MKLVIPGGSGQVGTLVARHFHQRGDDVVILTRRPTGGRAWREVVWDTKTRGDWHREIDGADVVLNLAGRSVNCRYNKKNRRLIMDSRVDSTKAVGGAIAAASRPPKVWLQMSTATIYGHSPYRDQDEATGTLGAQPSEPDTWHFSYDVARQWEAAANAFDLPATRLVLLRSAMVMSPDRGGIFDVLLGLVRRGLGGPILGSPSIVSWVHEHDFNGIVDFLLTGDEISGPINVTSPDPLPYAEFMRTLRQAWGQPIGLPATPLMIEIGTRLMRTESELVLKSRRVVPGRLKELGFAFRQPLWEAAAKDLVERYIAYQ